MDNPKSIEGKCSVVIAKADHVGQLYPFMREADQIEVTCMGKTPKEALLEALEEDDATFTALDPNDVPIAMFGVGTVEGEAYIWCLGTDAVNDNGYDFIKASRKWTQLLIQDYGSAFNFVHEDNAVAKKWLKFCGAEMLGEIEINGYVFNKFVIRYNAPTTVALPLAEFREKVVQLEEQLRENPNAIVEQEDIDRINPLMHSFGDKLYVRTIKMPAGQLVVSKIHKHTHPYFVMKGDVSVLTEEGVVRIKAPYQGITKEGTKRVLFIHEETVWTTVHHTEETELDKIEQDIIATSFDDPQLALTHTKNLLREI